MELRNYQVECLAAIRREWQAIDRTLAVLSTGTGKTIIFLALLAELLRDGQLSRCLILAHQRKLIQQPVERARQFFPEVAREMGVVMAGEDQAAARIVVATAQTLARPARLERLLAHGPISHLIVDEVHHYTAPTFKSVIDRLAGAKIAGFTATPRRTDGDGLARIFQSVAYRLPIGAAIRRGALVPFDALGVGLPVSFTGLKQTEDGWEREAMGDLLRAENVLDIVFGKWREYAGDRQTIAYTASVAQARDTAEHFNRQGVKAAYVSGATPKKRQDEIARQFEAGGLQVVANCMIWTEGADFPRTAAILMIAPTKSDLIYVQRLGRGLRTAEGKADCRVLDFAPVEERDVVMAGDVLGKPREVRKAEAQAERQGVLVALSVNRLGEAATVDPDRLVVKVLNLLGKDALAWTVGADYFATAGLDAVQTLCIGLPQLERLAKAEELKRSDGWTERHADAYAFLSQYRLYHVNGAARLMGLFPTMDEAKARADALVLELGTEKVLSSKKSHWRKAEPTAGQLHYLASLGVSAPEGCTRGQAAQLITHALAVAGARRKEEALLRAIFRGEGNNQNAS